MFFADDLGESVAFGDARYADLRAAFHASRRAAGLPVPQMPDPAPFDVAGKGCLELRRFGAVILTAGYRPAYREWIQDAAAFDSLGFPLHRDGASTAIPGLYFAGVHFLRKRKSSLLMGVGEDARLIAERIAESPQGRPR